MALDQLLLQEAVQNVDIPPVWGVAEDSLTGWGGLGARSAVALGRARQLVAG